MEQPTLTSFFVCCPFERAAICCPAPAAYTSPLDLFIGQGPLPADVAVLLEQSGVVGEQAARFVNAVDELPRQVAQNLRAASHASLSELLESCKPGFRYGLRFVTPLIAAGYEDLDDFRSVPPSVDDLRDILVPVGAKEPQVALVTKRLRSLGVDVPDHQRGGGSGSSGNLSPASQQDLTTTDAEQPGAGKPARPPVAAVFSVIGETLLLEDEDVPRAAAAAFDADEADDDGAVVPMSTPSGPRASTRPSVMPEPAPKKTRASSASATVADEDDELPISAVSIEHLTCVIATQCPPKIEAMIEAHREDGTTFGRGHFEFNDASKATIWHMVEAFVKPTTLELKTSYVDLLHSTRAGPNHWGRASAMLSYSWEYQYLVVIETLRQWAGGCGFKDSNTNIWMCCLNVNQHVLPCDTASFAQTFKGRVESIGTLLPMLCPWKAPAYVQRLWCLFELHTASMMKSVKIDVIMPASEEAQMIEELHRPGGVRQFEDMLDGIDSELADASYLADAEYINLVIRESCGFFMLDEVIRGRIRKGCMAHHDDDDQARLSRSSLQMTPGIAQWEGMHVMLSYEHYSQTKVIRIKQRLSELGIPCWIDADQTTTDVHDGIVEALEGAVAVICFVDQRYQDSQACSLELTFAHNTGRTIIPVVLAERFRPSRWLKGVIGHQGQISMWSQDSADFEAGIASIVASIKVAQNLSGALPVGSVASSPGLARRGVTELDNAAFSTKDLRDELERMRKELVAPSVDEGLATDRGKFATLPASVPDGLPPNMRVTEVMKTVREAVLSAEVKHVGIYGMGGVGKSTLTTWIVKEEKIRAHFETICWIPLGQTPDLAVALALLHLQLTGGGLDSDMSAIEQQECVTQALKGRSMLLVLDDVWKPEHGRALERHVDASTASTVIISSRVHEAVHREGGTSIPVELPTMEAATEMLLQAAGLSGGDEVPAEARTIAEHCNRLPLMIGIAGKLIKSMGIGGSESGAWDGALEQLQEEFAASGHSANIHESVIKVSLNSIDSRFREHATQLLTAFSLVPEDTMCPLPVLVMLVEATAGHKFGKTESARTRHVRALLKTLIDLSLVLGTVDRPSVHDIVLDYVTAQVTPHQLQERHTTVVEAFRNNRPLGQGGWDRLAAGRSSPVVAYVCDHTRHHMRFALGLNPEFVDGSQVTYWLDDTVGGRLDAIAMSAVEVIGWDTAKKLAADAAAAGRWWSSAIRWSALSVVAPTVEEHRTCSRTAANLLHEKKFSSSNVGAGGPRSQDELDHRKLITLHGVLGGWNPIDFGEFAPRLLAMEGCRAEKEDFITALLSSLFKQFAIGHGTGNEKMAAQGSLGWHKSCRAAIESQLGASVQEGHFAFAKAFQYFAGAAMAVETLDDFDIGIYGDNGARLLEAAEAYEYAVHHVPISTMATVDQAISLPNHVAPLMWHFVNPERVHRILELHTRNIRMFARDPQNRRFPIDIIFVLCTWPYVYYMAGQLDKYIEICKAFGIVDFNSIRPIMAGICGTSPLFRPWGGDAMEVHLYATESATWTIQTFWLLHELANGTSTATIAALSEELPRGAEWIERSKCHAGWDQSVIMTVSSQTFPGWLFEKLGQHERALEHFEIATVTTATVADAGAQRGGNIKYRFHTIAHTARMRIFAEIGKPADATAEFEQAQEIAVRMQLHGFEAVVLRERAKYATGAPKQAAKKQLATVLAALRATKDDLEYIHF